MARKKATRKKKSTYKPNVVGAFLIGAVVVIGMYVWYLSVLDKYVA